MQSSRPRLVIVSGAPASGKTTLAQLLASDGGLTLVSKDRIKEGLADTLGRPETVGASRRLGIGAYAALYAMAREQVAAGVGTVVESNFRRGFSEPELAGIGRSAEVRIVHCVAEPSTIHARYGDRAAERHAAHLDEARHQDVMRELLDGVYEPLELEAPLMRVRTDDGYEPPYEEVRAFALGASEA